MSVSHISSQKDWNGLMRRDSGYSYNPSSHLEPKKESSSQRIPTKSLLFGLDLAISQYLRIMDYLGTLSLFVPECGLKQALLDHSNEELLEDLFFSKSNDYLTDYIRSNTGNIDERTANSALLIQILNFVSSLEEKGFLTPESLSYLTNGICLPCISPLLYCSCLFSSLKKSSSTILSKR